MIISRARTALPSGRPVYRSPARLGMIATPVLLSEPLSYRLARTVRIMVPAAVGGFDHSWIVRRAWKPEAGMAFLFGDYALDADRRELALSGEAIAERLQRPPPGA